MNSLIGSPVYHSFALKVPLKNRASALSFFDKLDVEIIFLAFSGHQIKRYGPDLIYKEVLPSYLVLKSHKLKMSALRTTQAMP
jgi:hypothetical protein